MRNFYRWQYPGDPVSTAVEMTAEEFLAENPDRAIELRDFDGNLLSSIPVTEVICDLCNAEITDHEQVTLTDDRAYCEDCADEWVRPHRIK